MAKTKISTVVTTETTTTEIQEFTISTNLTVAPCAYKFGDQSIRVFTIDNQPWFVAVDICKALDIQNPTMAVQKLDEDERMQVIDSSTLHSIEGTQINNLLNVVSESGMNALVLRCRDAMTQGTPAHKFRKWVTSEVLPSLRKTGSYHTQPTAVKPTTITNAQYNRIRDLIYHMSRYTHNKDQTVSMLMNHIRFMTNIEHVKDLPADQFEAVINHLNHRQQLAENHLLPLLVEAEDYFFREIICNGVAFTGTIRKNLKKLMGEALPKPINWKEAALQLEALPC